MTESYARKLRAALRLADDAKEEDIARCRKVNLRKHAPKIPTGPVIKDAEPSLPPLPASMERLLDGQAQPPTAI